MIHQFRRLAPAALLQAQLEFPDLPHGLAEAARNRYVLSRLGDGLLGGAVHRRNRRVAALPQVPGLAVGHRPQQGRQQERRGDRFVGGDTLVGVDHRRPHQCQGVHVALQALGGAGEQVLEQLVLHQQFQGGRRVTGQEQFEEFVEQPGGGDFPQQVGAARNGPGRVAVDLEAEFRGEAQHPQHAHRVFRVSHRGITDDADCAPLEVLEPVYVIEDLEGARVVVQRVHRQVAPHGVLFQGAVDIVPQQQSAGGLPRVVAAGLGGRLGIVVVMAAKGGDLDDFPAEAHVDDAETPADDAGIAKQGMHGLGGGIGGDIKVLGVTAQQQVAHGAAYQVCLVATAAQARHDLECAIADVLAGYAVLVPGDDFQAGLCL